MSRTKKYGYMRVSSKEQNEDRQRIALLEEGVPEKNIYMDKQSGKNFERKQIKIFWKQKRGEKMNCYFHEEKNINFIGNGSNFAGFLWHYRSR